MGGLRTFAAGTQSAPLTCTAGNRGNHVYELVRFRDGTNLTFIAPSNRVAYLELSLARRGERSGAIIVLDSIGALLVTDIRSSLEAKN